MADHPNCFGVKLTCGNIGKGVRISNHTRSAEFLKKKGAFLNQVIEGGEFQLLPGFADTLLPALTVHHTGAITSTGAMVPKTVRKLYDLSLQGIAGDHKAFLAAVELQERVSRCDGIAISYGIPGLKYFLDHFVEQGLGGDSRYPLSRFSEESKKSIVEQLKGDWEYEASL